VTCYTLLTYLVPNASNNIRNTCSRLCGDVTVHSSAQGYTTTDRVCCARPYLLSGSLTDTVKYYNQWRTQEFCSGVGVQQIQLRTADKERDLGAVAPYPLVKGSGGSCNLVQEISFHIVKVS